MLFSSTMERKERQLKERIVPSSIAMESGMVLMWSDSFENMDTSYQFVHSEHARVGATVPGTVQSSAGYHEMTHNCHHFHDSPGGKHFQAQWNKHPSMTLSHKMLEHSHKQKTSNGRLLLKMGIIAFSCWLLDGFGAGCTLSSMPKRDDWCGHT